MIKIRLPTGAEQILNKLDENGYAAYVVGGCVRDSLLGIKPKDWDICTSATPSQIKEVFTDSKTIDTGIKHGTITVVIDDEHYEITTFRIDGEYSDCRRPDSVEFVSDIEQDLARRDFTINALAYRPGFLLDLNGGANHLKSKKITCVGNPDDRFNEDALRIMRALRFASVYGFEIDSNTSEAIHRNAHPLNKIAVERINTELCKLLRGKGVLQILLDYSDVFSVVLPEIKPCIGFDQNNKYHCFTVYEHIAHAVANYPGADISVKLALLLHDIGKPTCYSEDENGGHFYGHGVPSADIAEQALKRLRFDSVTQQEVTELVLYHDSIIEPTSKTIRRWLNKVGEKQFARLLDIRKADILAHTEGTQQERIDKCTRINEVFSNILAEDQCFSLKKLNLRGRDLIEIGLPEGEKIGEILRVVLNKVIEGELENERDILVQYVREVYVC